ncbi:hypothetical protein JTB14_001369 [Gonioctena quinquepunctata]|nr:hypothetical protein JTB14_001369 [Gonioctena quinquepunctata]
MIIGVVYHQPGTNVSDFLRELNSVIECSYVEAVLIVVMGDININSLCPDSSDSKNFRSLLADYGSLLMVKNPMRVTDTLESLIVHAPKKSVIFQALPTAWPFSVECV